MIDKKAILDVSKIDSEKPDLNISNSFLKPDKKCPLCRSKAALMINENFLQQKDIDYKKFCEVNKEHFFQLCKKRLTTKLVTIHFEEHFNAKTEALVKHNLGTIMTDIIPQDETKPAVIQDELTRVYSLLTDSYVNDLKILDFSVKEQLHHLHEIREVKAQRREQGVGVIDLIMKEEDILRSIQFSLINKIKVFQTGKLQQAQTSAINSMNFLNAATMNLLGSDVVALNPNIMKQSQDLFVSTVFSHFLKRVNICIAGLNISSEQKALFFSNLKRELNGVEQEIYADFERDIKGVNIVDAQFVENSEDE